MTQAIPVAGQGELPVYEHIYDAMRACVQASGGAKTVGHKLWPTKDIEQARKDCIDCLNPNNARKFDPQETLMVFELAKDAGFHTGWHYACDRIGYHRSMPVTAREQAESLAERGEQLVREMRALTTQMERLNTSGALKGFPKAASG